MLFCVMGHAPASSVPCNPCTDTCTTITFDDAVAQVKYSILDRGPEQDGTVAKCTDLGVSVIAHSPLEQGLLTARGLEGTDQKAQQVRFRLAHVMHGVQHCWHAGSVNSPERLGQQRNVLLFDIRPCCI